MPRAEIFGDLITADHKVPSEESESQNNHRHAVVVQDMATQWIQSYLCKSKSSQETQKNLMNFLEPTRKPKSFTLTIAWNLASLATNHPGIIVRQHHTDQKQIGMLKEQFADWKKGLLRCYCTPVWVTNGGRIPWNATAICEIFRIFLWWEDTLWKAVRNDLWRTSSTVWSNDRMSPYFCWRLVTTASIRSWSLARDISR